MIPLSRVKLPPEPPVPLGATCASVGAIVARVPIAHARGASGRGMRQTDALLTRLGQGAFEVAGDLAKEGGVGGGVNRLRHRCLRSRGLCGRGRKAGGLRVGAGTVRAGRRYATVFVSTPPVPCFPRRCPPVRRDLRSRTARDN